MTGRYYQVANHEAPTSAAAALAAVSAAAAAATAEPRVAEPAARDTQRSALLAEFEQRVAADPGNEELWLLFALQHIDFGAVESMQGGHTLRPCHCRRSHISP